MRPPTSLAGTVLIVEDAETCATTLELACSGIPGIDLHVALSSSEALGVLRDENRRVIAVITDLQMPRMTGYELIQLLRADRRYGQVPIIVVSGDTDPRAPERSLEMGANAFFSKPYSPSLVRQKLEQFLDAYRKT